MSHSQLAVPVFLTRELVLMLNIWKWGSLWKGAAPWQGSCRNFQFNL